jgi:hypothetical protein
MSDTHSSTTSTSATTTTTTPSNPLLIVEYNMLEQSLASPSIPWILTLPPSLISRINLHLKKHPHTHTPTSGVNRVARVIDDWGSLHKHVSLIYHKHWHRNRNVRNYKALRRMFGCDLTKYMPCNGVPNDDHPKGLDNVSILSRDALSISSGGSSNGVAIPTLQNILHSVLTEDGGGVRESMEFGETSSNSDDEYDSSSASSSLPATVFKYIKHLQSKVYDWPVRGPRILKLITNNFGHGMEEEEEGVASSSSASSYFPPPSMYGDLSTTTKKTSALNLGPHLPDVIVLLECDAHGPASQTIDPPSSSRRRLSDATLRFCSPSDDEEDSYNHPSELPFLDDIASDNDLKKDMSFSTALNQMGYHSLLFESPSCKNSGIAVFARVERFEVEGFETKKDDTSGRDVSLNLKIRSGPLPPPTRSSSSSSSSSQSPPPSLLSVDLLDIYPDGGDDDPPKYFAPGDRKICGVCPLLFKEIKDNNTPNQKKKKSRLLLLPTHLMTSSRDTFTPYIGAVRSRELESISTIAKRYVGSDDKVVFLGDFNINLRPKGHKKAASAAAAATGSGAAAGSTDGARDDAESFIFEGLIQPSTTCEVETGSEASILEPLRFETGYKPSTTSSGEDPSSASSFKWSRNDGCSLVLRDVYEGYNKKAFTDDHHQQQQHIIGTSRNAMRIETIDYVFYEKKEMDVVWRSELLLKGRGKTQEGEDKVIDHDHDEDDGRMPNETEPSDHIPVVVLFDVK